MGNIKSLRRSLYQGDTIFNFKSKSNTMKTILLLSDREYTMYRSKNTPCL